MRVVGLKSAHVYNGRIGMVVGFDSEMGRFDVLLSPLAAYNPPCVIEPQELLKVKRLNLEVLVVDAIDSEDELEVGMFAVGDRCKVVMLQSKQSQVYNGQNGLITKFEIKDKRYNLMVDAPLKEFHCKVLSVRRQNLASCVRLAGQYAPPSHNQPTHPNL